MNEKDLQLCHAGKIFFQKLSSISLVNVLIIGFLFGLLFIESDHNIFQIIIFSNIVLSFVVILQGWHLYFDSGLFDVFGKNQQTTYIDYAIEEIFGKKSLKNKSVQQRFDGSIKCGKNFLLTFFINFCFFLGNCFYFIIT